MENISTATERLSPIQYESLQNIFNIKKKSLAVAPHNNNAIKSTEKQQFIKTLQRPTTNHMV